MSQLILSFATFRLVPVLRETRLRAKNVFMISSKIKMFGKGSFQSNVDNFAETFLLSVETCAQINSK